MGWRTAAAGGEQWQEGFPFSRESSKVCSFGNRGIRSTGIRERQQAESLSCRKQQEAPKKCREHIFSQASVITEKKRIPRRSVWVCYRLRRQWMLLEGKQNWSPPRLYSAQGENFCFLKIRFTHQSWIFFFKNENPLTTQPPHIWNLTLATTVSILIWYRWWFWLYFDAWVTWEPVTSLGENSVQRAPASLNYVHPLSKVILMDSVCFPD